MDTNLKQLKKFGLSEKEAQTYLSLLELGESSVNEIAKESGVNRSTAYVVLEALEKKGLVTATQNEAVQRFNAVEPEVLSQMANERLNEFQNIAESMKHLVPDLKSIHKENKHRPKVRVLEGTDGVREAYRALFDVASGEFLTYSNGQAIIKLLPEFVSMASERIKRGVTMRAINPHSNIYEILIREKAYIGDQFVLIPKRKFTFESDLAIYDNYVGLVSQEEQFAVIIESKHIANAMRTFFNHVWESSKSIGTHIVGTHQVDTR